jgi:hypothetical protein
LVNDAFREGMTDEKYQNTVKDIHRSDNGSKTWQKRRSIHASEVF